MAERLDVDGWYFDGTNLGSHGSGGYKTGCCCPRCAEAFEEASGYKIPMTVDFTLPSWAAFLSWRQSVIAEFMRDVTAAVRAVRPHAILDFNHYGGAYNRWDLAHPTGLALPGDVGGANAAHFFTEMTSKDGAAMAAKYARAHRSRGGGVWMGIRSHTG